MVGKTNQFYMDILDSEQSSHAHEGSAYHSSIPLDVKDMNNNILVHKHVKIVMIMTAFIVVTAITIDIPD